MLGRHAPCARTVSWGPGGVLHDSSGDGTTYTPGLSQRTGTTDRFAHADWLGSTRYLSDATGNGIPNALRYDAFGGVVANAGGVHPTDFLFAGGHGYQSEYRSDTEPGLGLQYLQQRYYDPEVGRFITPDPIGYAGGLNLYGYCGGDPVNGVDPRGLEEKVPSSWGEMFRNAKGDFANAPENRPGSKKRCDYSGQLSMLPIVGLVKTGYEAATGRDPVAGVKLSSFQRTMAVIATFSLGLSSYLKHARHGEAVADAAGLGVLAGKSVSISPEGLAMVQSHLARFESQAYNVAMVQRLQSALAAGQKLTGADAAFYVHEIAEATAMSKGLAYEAAHAQTLAKYGVSPFALYHPDVIRAHPEDFNDAWFEFWRIKRP